MVGSLVCGLEEMILVNSMKMKMNKL